MDWYGLLSMVQNTAILVLIPRIALISDSNFDSNSRIDTYIDSFYKHSMGYGLIR